MSPVVPIAPVSPYYDERFEGHGHHKVQYMAHVRWLGYQFVVLPNGGFLVHSPYTLSSQKSISLNKEKVLHRNNTEQLEQFIEELDETYGSMVAMTNKETGELTYLRDCISLNITTTQPTIPSAYLNNQNLEIALDWGSLTHMHSSSVNRTRRTIKNNIHIKNNRHNSTNHINAGNQTSTFIPMSSCPKYLIKSNISVTLLTQSSISRLYTLDVTCRRWKSPIIVVVAVSDPIDATSGKLLQNHIAKWNVKCQQLQVILYHLDHETEGAPASYPINTIRNIALEAASTSHILMMDVDFIPSEGLDNMIRSTILEQEDRIASRRNASQSITGSVGYDNFGNEMYREAIVIPAFNRGVQPQCKTSEMCAQLLQNNSKFIPSNFEELRHCYEKKACTVFDKGFNDDGHSSTRTDMWFQKKWYVSNDESVRTHFGTESNVPVKNTTNEQEDDKMIRTLSCFDSLGYEPYVVLRWCPSSSSSAHLRPIVAPVAPYYDERFLGYGHNKIQYIVHIRWMGYRFLVLPDGGFLVHSPHVISSQKKYWLKRKNELRWKNTDLFYAFIDELDSIYNVTATKTKDDNNNRIYPRQCVKPNMTILANVDSIQHTNETTL
jgi:glycosyltransferase-like protein LARGE